MKVLLVDDHSLFREGVSLFLQRLGEDIEFVHADNPTDACELAEQQGPFHLVLLDYSIPGVNDLDLYFAIRQRVSNTPIALLTGEINSNLIHRALQAGINGYITKNSPLEVMLSAVRLVLSGGLYIPAQILSDTQLRETSFVPGNQNPHGSQNPHGNNDEALAKPSSVSLTDRQQQVLEEMAKGLSNKEIARELAMSPSTVKVHVASILRELEVKNRTRAVTLAKEMGLIHN